MAIYLILHQFTLSSHPLIHPINSPYHHRHHHCFTGASTRYSSPPRLTGESDIAHVGSATVGAGPCPLLSLPPLPLPQPHPHHHHTENCSYPPPPPPLTCSYPFFLPLLIFNTPHPLYQPAYFTHPINPITPLPYQHPYLTLPYPRLQSTVNESSAQGTSPTSLTLSTLSTLSTPLTYPTLP